MTSTLRKHRPEHAALGPSEGDAAPESTDGVIEPSNPASDFDAVYVTYFQEVMRWIRAMGGREPDQEDLAQEVFMIVGRKLQNFDGQNIKGWLYRITQRTVRDYRRAAWFRNLFGGKKVLDSEPALLRLVEPGKGPNEHVEQQEAARTMAMILERMRDKQRTAFVLFEIEGYSGEEIAELENVPLNTIWSRLHHARKDFTEI